MGQARRHFRGLRLVFSVFWDAYWHFSADDGWALASHVALSGLLALFPFLIFGTALAGFLGAGGFADTVIQFILETWPLAIAEPIAAEIRRVLEIPRGGLLTISVLAAAYFASNGVEALRIALNRAYRVSETRPWYLTRLFSLAYVVVAVVVLAAVSLMLVNLPLVLGFAERHFPQFADDLAALFNFSVYSAYSAISVLIVALLLTHKWLPDGSRRLIDVVPGVILTLVVWAGFGLFFAYYLSTFANYAATYAGLASIMVVLIFLYMLAVIMILGAQFNAALKKYRVYSVYSHMRRVRRLRRRSRLRSKAKNVGG